MSSRQAHSQVPPGIMLLTSELNQILLPHDEIPQPSKQLQTEISHTFWPSTHGGTSQPDEISQPAYFQYFRSELEAWRLSGSPVALETYRDLLELVKLLRVNRHERRDSPSILGFFQQSSSNALTAHAANTHPTQHESVSMRNAIDLAIRLWLMLNVVSEKTALFPARSSLVWTDAQSLNMFIEKYFTSGNATIGRTSDLAISFNAHDLKYIGGFDIVWTDHLADHLYLNEDLGTVSLFHHASVLHMAVRCNAAE